MSAERQGSIYVDDISHGSGGVITDQVTSSEFEILRSKEQNLSFETFDDILKQKQIILDDAKKLTLGITRGKNIYTNLALLLSEQCEHTIKLNIFNGSSKIDFRERKEFRGSVINQFYDVCTYIKKSCSTLYPDIAIKEAVSNAIVHRDYTYSGGIIINIFADKIEFLSIGGLIGQITLNDILLGMSQSRNEMLANIFYMLMLSETYGAGIQRIYASYINCSQKPSVKISDNVFTITLPNMKFADANLSEHEQKIMNYLDSHQFINRKQAEKVLYVSQTMAGRVLKKLVELGLTKQLGNSVGIKYTINN
ncbi:MAG: hypothetical protein A2Y17_03620 [Clostridiales bacterium GWF2_38_85]|nr:MAG: hypothetical protein A2Y17_03620 [Clostridiales bacterium GWF2_38_85]HBL85297.1 hypothetical protein [Clostridiales bacterium]